MDESDSDRLHYSTQKRVNLTFSLSLSVPQFEQVAVTFNSVHGPFGHGSKPPPENSATDLESPRFLSSIF